MIVKQSNKIQKKLFLKRSKKTASVATLFFGIIFTSVLSFSVSNEKHQVQSFISKIKYFWNLSVISTRSPYKEGDSNTFGIGYYENKPDFPGVKRIFLDIKHKHWESLKIHRDQSLKSKKVIRYKNPYVPAKIRFKNKTYKARIRFKGNFDHLKKDKWSFRVILKKKKTLFGMKQFSLQHPSQRAWLYEKIIHLAMKREGLLGLRYDFIYLTINGKNMGIYAIEEHFEKRLVENNRRINGPILKFYRSYLTRFDAAKTESVKKNPILYQQYQKAKGILAALIVGELTVEEVFDLKKLAKFAALIDLFGAHHGAHWSSSRMYYNPVTSRLEIFCYDNNIIGYFEPLIGAGRSYFQEQGPNTLPFFDILFNDPVFFKEYVNALKQVAKQSYLKKMLSDFKNVIDRDEKVLQSEWVSFGFTKQWMFDTSRVHPSSVSFLYQTQKKIQTILSGKGAIKAYHQKNQDNKTILALKNTSPMPIEVIGIYFQNTLHPPTKKTILPVKPLKSEAKVKLVNFPKLDIVKTQNYSAKLKYEIMGANLIQEVNISQKPLKEGIPFKAAPNISLNRKNLTSPCPKVQTINELKEYEFLDFKLATNEIFIRTGTWELSKNLILPEGHKVIIQPKAQIIFKNCASIITYSPVTYIGEQIPFDIYYISKDITRQKSNLAEFKFLNINEKEKNISIRKGRWELSKNLIIPKGYKLFAGPGTQINLSNGANLLSYSPIDFKGTKEEPIIIQSLDKSGGGLAVINAGNKSNLRHTSFKGLSTPESKGWKLTGAVTFYESDIQIENCQFFDNDSEDSLHVLRSKVQIYNTHFKDTYSDAFDGDFINGKIIKSTFQNTGNDAIDISGTRLKIKDVQIELAKDKGISAGENSRILINNLAVKQAKIAIASKDMSNILAKNISIKDSTIGFAAYQKKPEFGPAKINVAHVIHNNLNNPFMVETGSTLLVDGIEHAVKQNDAYKLLYPKIN
ncbi:MAG: CotH kinase family protein [Nitrospinota bacterium]|nr:CotH kinase family protein [Nitrospinota bacterium]